MAISKKGSRVLKVFKALEAHPIIGLSNKEIADGLGISAVHVSRDLDDNRRRLGNQTGQRQFCLQH